MNDLRKSISMKSVKELSKIGLSRASSSSKKNSIIRRWRITIKKGKMKKTKKSKRV